MKFKFKNKHHGKIFEIESYHPADPTHQSVWLKCVNDPKLVLETYVRMSELELL